MQWARILAVCRAGGCGFVGGGSGGGCVASEGLNNEEDGWW